MNIKKISICALALVSVFLSPIALSKSKQQPYNVELLVFTNDPKSFIDAENWVKKPLNIDHSKISYISYRKAASVLDSDPNRISVNYKQNLQPVFISAKNFQLKNTAHKISQSEDQKIIYHRVWQQDFILESRSRPIYITSSDYIQDTKDDLQGTVSIKKFRGFYHVKVDLAYANSNLRDDVGYFQLKSDGKLNHGKIFYFDHPAFGALMIIS